MVREMRDVCIVDLRWKAGRVVAHLMPRGLEREGNSYYGSKFTAKRGMPDKYNLEN